MSLKQKSEVCSGVSAQVVGIALVLSQFTKFQRFSFSRHARSVVFRIAQRQIEKGLTGRESTKRKRDKCPDKRTPEIEIEIETEIERKNTNTSKLPL